MKNGSVQAPFPGPVYHRATRHRACFVLFCDSKCAMHVQTRLAYWYSPINMMYLVLVDYFASVSPPPPPPGGAQDPLLLEAQ